MQAAGSNVSSSRWLEKRRHGFHYCVALHAVQHGETMSHYLYKAVIKLGLSPIDVRRDFSFSHMRKEVNEHVASGDWGLFCDDCQLFSNSLLLTRRAPVLVFLAMFEPKLLFGLRRSFRIRTLVSVGVWCYTDDEKTLCMPLVMRMFSIVPLIFTVGVFAGVARYGWNRNIVTSMCQIG